MLGNHSSVLPDDVDIVGADLPVTGDQRQSFPYCLSNQDPVERIPVKIRQCRRVRCPEGLSLPFPERISFLGGKWPVPPFRQIKFSLHGTEWRFVPWANRRQPRYSFPMSTNHYLFAILNEVQQA